MKSSTVLFALLVALVMLQTYMMWDKWRKESVGGSISTNTRVGRMQGTSPGVGPIGYCVCPSCGTRIAHKAGAPCYNFSCPKCGTKMVR